jgi:hypothetical protein
MPIDLRLDKHEVNEEHDKVMLDILVAEATAVATDGETDAVAAGFVASAGAPQGANRRATFYADGHCRRQPSCGELMRGVTGWEEAPRTRVVALASTDVE